MSVVPPPPPAAHSWYVGDLDPTHLRALGSADEKSAAAVGLTRGVVVLDFGDPTATPGGTRLPDHRGPASPAAITAASVAYATGWAGVPGAVSLTLIVATSNDGDFVTAAQGEAWSGLVGEVARQSPSADVRGGFDAEPDYNDPAPTLAWVRGYRDTHGRPFVDIGDCACTPGQALPRGWSLHQRALVSLAGTVLPQQYRTSGIDATRWAHLDASTGKRLRFLGVLTETRACKGPPARACAGIDQSPAAAVTALSAKLGRAVTAASDIGYLLPPVAAPHRSHVIRDLAVALLVVLLALGALALAPITARRPR